MSKAVVELKVRRKTLLLLKLLCEEAEEEKVPFAEAVVQPNVLTAFGNCTIMMKLKSNFTTKSFSGNHYHTRRYEMF